MNMRSGTWSPYWIAAALCALATVASWQIVVVREDLRLLAVVAGAALLVALCVSRPQLTILVTMAWLPYLGFIRRALDPGGAREVDPFLTVVPLVTSVLLVGAAWSGREHLGSSLGRSRSALLVSLLVVTLVLAVFNPIQGGPLVGLSGTIFLFFPVLWFYLGRAYLDDDTVRRLLWITVWTGFVCALYGGYQAFFGFLPVEEHWIASRGFGSLYIGRFIRPFSTFPSPEEWTRHTMVAATASIGLVYAWGRRRWWLLIVSGTCLSALLLGGVRISVFGLIVSVAVLLAITARSRARAAVVLLGFAVALLAFASVAPQPSAAEIRASDAAWSAFFGHATRGVVAPLAEDTLWARIELWWDLFTNVLPHHPIGMGLSVPTLGAWKFDSEVNVGTESYAAAVFVAAGFIGGGLLLAVFAAVLTRAVALCRRPGLPVIRVATAVVAGIVFTSLVGNSLSLYTVGPLGWALMGWLSVRAPRENP
jgi:hypothetical protein